MSFKLILFFEIIRSDDVFLNMTAYFYYFIVIIEVKTNITTVIYDPHVPASIKKTPILRVDAYNEIIRRLVQ